MQITNFDATNIVPQQAGGKHPTGMFPVTITATRASPTGGDDKTNPPTSPTGGRFVVTFTSAAGNIEKGYNLWNPTPIAVEIAQKELSALCHATGIFKLSMSADNLSMCGHELRGASLVIDIQPQVKNPDFNEVRKVFDKNGNEPGKAAAAPQPQQGQGWQAGPQNPPTTQAPPTSNPPPAANSGGGWGNNQLPANPPAGGAAPPWAR